MTLILTALCKNGICICADRRYEIRDCSGLRIEDTHNKIFRFGRVPLVIVNHGINNIRDKDWKLFCSNYEQLDRWNNKNLFQIVTDFKEYIENDVVNELNVHRDGEKHIIGFLLAGTTQFDSKFKVNELFWSIDSDGVIKFELLRHRGFVMTGDTEECLNSFLEHHSEINTESYWKKLDTAHAERELKRIFDIAVQEKKQSNRGRFSDDCDTLCID